MYNCQAGLRNHICRFKKFLAFIILLMSYKLAVEGSETKRPTFIDPGEVNLTAHCGRYVDNPGGPGFGKCVKYCNNDVDCVAIRYNSSGCYAYKVLTVNNDILTEPLYVKDKDGTMSAEKCASQSAVDSLGNYNLQIQIVHCW